MRGRRRFLTERLDALTFMSDLRGLNERDDISVIEVAW